jgi:hypothetical protein
MTGIGPQAGTAQLGGFPRKVAVLIEAEPQIPVEAGGTPALPGDIPGHCETKPSRRLGTAISHRTSHR